MMLRVVWLLKVVMGIVRVVMADVWESPTLPLARARGLAGTRTLRAARRASRRSGRAP